jgi:hypothetical protein
MFNRNDKFKRKSNFLHIIVAAVPRQRRQTIVDAAVQRNDITPFLEHIDERQKVASLQAVLVQIVRLAIAGGHDHHATIEQICKQSFQYHRVRNVSDLQREVMKIEYFRS